jgi:L-arabinose isomerase
MVHLPIMAKNKISLMIDYDQYEVWFVTGSQHLYGKDVLKQVERHSKDITQHFSTAEIIPIKIVHKTLLTSPEEISNLCSAANTSKQCVGLITWMHTFSPAKMWISGLKKLRIPLLHLHTQYHVSIPWSEIDMDFMNLNQSAHGGREFGFINSRMDTTRKIVVGHFKEQIVVEQIAVWTRVCVAWQDSQSMKIARFGDNMREVAVTEGNQVSAQIQFGYSVNGYGLGDLSAQINAIEPQQIDETKEAYFDEYLVAPSMHKGRSRHQELVEAARIECGLRNFLRAGNFQAFTDTFENLHGLVQLPGIAVQRLMQDGYGFGAEGDWKVAALVRSMKVMGQGLSGGNSFMEDYTYHFEPGNQLVLGSHMLEICPSITQNKPSCEIHPLGIGGKSDPVRLVFDGGSGEALNASTIDLGDRFRLLVNKINEMKPQQDLPKLPVARVLWKPYPDLKTSATCWILAGGSHHTCFSQNLTIEYLEDFAEMAGIELVVIDQDTTISQFKKELKWNEIYYRMSS